MTTEPTKTTMEYLNAILGNLGNGYRTDEQFRGKFYAKYADPDMGWCAIDNSTLQAWTEDFPTMAAAVNWLNEN